MRGFRCHPCILNGNGNIQSTMEEVIMSTKIKVTILQGGAASKEVELNANPEPTIKCALQKAGISLPAAKEVRLNNRPSDFDTELNDGDIISVTSKVNGGSC